MDLIEYSETFRQMFMGVTFFSNPILDMFEDKPRRVHNKSKGSKSYHRRIQKKWNKRFGFDRNMIMFRTPDGIIANPGVIEIIKKTMKGKI